MVRERGRRRQKCKMAPSCHICPEVSDLVNAGAGSLQRQHRKEVSVSHMGDYNLCYLGYLVLAMI